MSQKIEFVGVGRMGANLARRLKECGFEISALYDLTRPPRKRSPGNWARRRQMIYTLGTNPSFSVVSR
jgi:3-hydroxyisobutyrate dehydrogenase-like beta-hydroxyacid dehydrogenase